MAFLCLSLIKLWITFLKFFIEESFLKYTLYTYAYMYEYKCVYVNTYSDIHLALLSTSFIYLLTNSAMLGCLQIYLVIIVFIYFFCLFLCTLCTETTKARRRYQDPLKQSCMTLLAAVWVQKQNPGLLHEQ